MEQVIKSDLIEKAARAGIETEYGVVSARTQEQTAFMVQAEGGAEDGAIATLSLTPYSAAMRRNPPLRGADRLPCMADVVRVDTNYISHIATSEAYRGRGYMNRLLSASLEYQNRMQTPFALLNAENGALFGRYGFHYIYDEPQYGLNGAVLSREMLERAAGGETVPVNAFDSALSVLDKNGLLTMAHFVNASLCKKYGLFIIRNALYYEKLQKELLENGANIYQITEHGRLRGCFIYQKGNKEPELVCEAVFEDDSELERYFCQTQDKKPAVMARIVNLREMLKHISSRGKVTVAVRLTDPVIAENDGLFIWYLDEKGSYMERVKEPEAGATPSMRPEVTATIGELTAFFFGYRALKQNMKFDSIYLSGPARVHEMAVRETEGKISLGGNDKWL